MRKNRKFKLDALTAPVAYVMPVQERSPQDFRSLLLLGLGLGTSGECDGNDLIYCDETPVELEDFAAVPGGLADYNDGESDRNVLQLGMYFEAATIMRWWRAGHPIDNRGDLIYWNTLCRTVKRRPRRNTTPIRLAVAVKLAWLDMANPFESDIEQVGKQKAGTYENAKTLAGKNRNWLDLVRDARASVASLIDPGTVRPEGESAALGLSDINFKRTIARRRKAEKKGRYNKVGEGGKTE